MKIHLSIVGHPSKSLIIEPWGEEFDVGSRKIEILFHSIGSEIDCEIEIDYSEDGFLRVENPLGFRPKVLIDGREDERPAFAFK